MKSPTRAVKGGWTKVVRGTIPIESVPPRSKLMKRETSKKPEKVIAINTMDTPQPQPYPIFIDAGSLYKFSGV
ncbi:MAG: hypothetical protein PHH26_00355 [Candidatus Thermoplasmatota archaeon]|nr:hypothetical protein [Candidatus Thermoplasmatota archaeon]